MVEMGDTVASRYRIEAELGRGGFAVVYEVTDLRTNIRRALKLLEYDERDDYSAGRRARFDREVSVLAQLRSQHTVSLVDQGTTEAGELFLVFEYLPGEDLRELLQREGRLDTEVARSILAQLLESLGEAHGLGLLHRDIKPENVRIFEQGANPHFAKLLDFGIARPTETAGPKLTATGELIGTPRYMSPEQLTERPLTAASDIYSLGVLGFEMLVGSDALQGNRWGDQFERLQSGYLFAAPGAADGDLLRVIQRMTARDPAQRYASARAVLGDLSPDAPQISVEENRPHATRTVLGVAALALLGVGIGIGSWLSREPPPPQPLPVARERLPAIIKGQEPPPPEPTTNDEPDAGVATLDAGKIAERSPSSGCGLEPPFRGASRFGSVGITEGTWDSYIPENYDPLAPAPLVVLLHTKAIDAGLFLEQSGFEELADLHGFVVAAPSDKVLPLFEPWEEEDDALFVLRLIDEMSASLCIDRDRVFVVGHGAGAYLAPLLMCQGVVRAGAMVSERRYGRIENCPTPAPLIWIDPMNSRRFPVGGGPNCRRINKPSQVSVEKFLKKKYACRGKPRTTQKREDGECHTWSCGTDLEVCTVRGGERWPDMPATKWSCGDTSPTFPHAEAIWAFFSRVSAQPAE